MPGTTTTGVHRRPAFTDTTNGTQLVLTIVSVNGASVQQTSSYRLSTGGGSPVTCTSATTPVCTLSALIPVGQDTIEFTEEDSNNRPLAQNFLSTNIVPGNNTVSVTLNGLVASLSAPVCGSVTFTSSGESIPVTVVAKDVDAAAIAAPGLFGAAAASTSTTGQLNPLTISSTAANASFSVNGAAASNPATVNGPADTVKLIYNGAAPSGGTVPVTVSASVANSVPGVAAVGSVTASCSLSQNSSYGADPVTTFSSVADSSTWSSASTSNAFNALCNSGTQTLCYYPITGGAFGPVTTTSQGRFSFSYAGYALVNYASTAYTNFSLESIVLTFTDEANAANTFTASFGPSTLSWINGSATTPATITTTGLAAPGAPALTLGTNPGGTATNYDYVVITYVNSLGETVASAQTRSGILTPGRTVNVTSPAASGNATGYNVYAAQTTATTYAGAYYKQNTSAIAIGTNYTIGGTPSTTGAQPPAVNTTDGSTVKNTFSINGGTGVFAGVSGSLSIPFSLTSSEGTQSLFSSSTDSGTIYGI